MDSWKPREGAEKNMEFFEQFLQGKNPIGAARDDYQHHCRQNVAATNAEFPDSLS